LVIGGTSAEANLAAVKKHRRNIMIIFRQKEMKQDRLSEIWNGKQKFRKSVRKVLLEHSLEENI
jgi:predicted metal-binding protein